MGILWRFPLLSVCARAAQRKAWKNEDKDGGPGLLTSPASWANSLRNCRTSSLSLASMLEKWLRGGCRGRGSQSKWGRGALARTALDGKVRVGWVAG